LALIVGGGFLGGTMIKDVSKLREFDESIREQLQTQRDIEEKRMALTENLERARERISDIPDSLSSARGPATIRESMNYGKQEQILDGKAIRVERMLDHLEGERAKVMDHLKRWGMRLGAVELVLIGLLVGLRRTAA
jgi:hypothetical protein